MILRGEIYDTRLDPSEGSDDRIGSAWTDSWEFGADTMTPALSVTVLQVPQRSYRQAKHSR